MTSFEMVPSAAQTLVARLAQLVQPVVDGLCELGRAHRARRLAAALERFDDRMLADVGLVRGDVLGR